MWPFLRILFSWWFIFSFLSSVFRKPLIIHSFVRRSFRHLIAWNCNVQYFSLFFFVYLWELVSTSGKCIFLNISLPWSSVRSAMSLWWEISTELEVEKSDAINICQLVMMLYPFILNMLIKSIQCCNLLLMGHFF